MSLIPKYGAAIPRRRRSVWIHFYEIREATNPPPLRHQPHLRLHKPTGKQLGNGRLQPGRLLAGRLGVDRVEVRRTRTGRRPGQLLQGAVHGAVEFDLVVQGAEDVRDGVLLGEGSDTNVKCLNLRKINGLMGYSVSEAIKAV